jgi:hypothetical protein
MDTWIAESTLGEWSWSDGINAQPVRDAETNPALDILEGPLKIGETETLGNQNACLQSYMELRTNNHCKMQRIAQLTLSEGLGLGCGKKAIAEVLESLEEFLSVCDIKLITCQILKMYSEVAVHRKQDPKEVFDERTDNELNRLYPIELADSMSECLGTAWKGKQCGSTITTLKAMHTYKDDASDLRAMEWNKQEAIKEKERNRKQEHHEVKVLETACMRRAQRVAKQQSGILQHKIPANIH